MTYYNVCGSLIAKMNENHLKDFSDDELRRVFAHTVSPVCCIRATKKLLAERLIIFDGDKVTTIETSGQR